MTWHLSFPSNCNFFCQKGLNFIIIHHISVVPLTSMEPNHFFRNHLVLCLFFVLKVLKCHVVRPALTADFLLHCTSPGQKAFAVLCWNCGHFWVKMTISCCVVNCTEFHGHHVYSHWVQHGAHVAHVVTNVCCIQSLVVTYMTSRPHRYNIKVLPASVVYM